MAAGHASFELHRHYVVTEVWTSTVNELINEWPCPVDGPWLSVWDDHDEASRDHGVQLGPSTMSAKYASSKTWRSTLLLIVHNNSISVFFCL